MGFHPQIRRYMLPHCLESGRGSYGPLLNAIRTHRFTTSSFETMRAWSFSRN